MGNTMPVPAPAKAKVITAQNPAQARYLSLMAQNTLTFGLGPAGTGKTFLAAAFAAEQLQRGLVDKIYVTRPAVEAGENLGFLPGDMDEKTAPYFAPVLEALTYVMGAGRVKYALASKEIEFVPIAFMRGRSLHRAIVLIDEAQNTTPLQMKMLLTRAGQGTKLIVSGDLLQSDIAPAPNGLRDAVLKFQGKPDVGLIKFRRDEVVRSGFAALAVEVYEGNQGEQDDALEDGECKLPAFITQPAVNDDFRHDLFGRLPREPGS